MIRMIEPSSGQLFAQCLIPGSEYEKYVEPVVDSSRYFVLKITNGQRHAFIGLGFEDRSESFDFKCALSDCRNKGGNHTASDGLPERNDSPARDLSLKEGQRITVNLKG